MQVVEQSETRPDTWPCCTYEMTCSPIGVELHQAFLDPITSLSHDAVLMSSCLCYSGGKWGLFQHYEWSLRQTRCLLTRRLVALKLPPLAQDQSETQVKIALYSNEAQLNVWLLLVRGQRQSAIGHRLPWCLRGLAGWLSFHCWFTRATLS